MWVGVFSVSVCISVENKELVHASIPIAILTVLTLRTLWDAIVPADGAVGLCISLTDSNPSLRIDIFSLLLSSLPFSCPTNSS